MCITFDYVVVASYLVSKQSMVGPDVEVRWYCCAVKLLFRFVRAWIAANEFVCLGFSRSFRSLDSE